MKCVIRLSYTNLFSPNMCKLFKRTKRKVFRVSIIIINYRDEISLWTRTRFEFDYFETRVAVMKAFKVFSKRNYQRLYLEALIKVLKIHESVIEAPPWSRY